MTHSDVNINPVPLFDEEEDLALDILCKDAFGRLLRGHSYGTVIDNGGWARLFAAVHPQATLTPEPKVVSLNDAGFGFNGARVSLNQGAENDDDVDQTARSHLAAFMAAPAFVSSIGSDDADAHSDKRMVVQCNAQPVISDERSRTFYDGRDVDRLPIGIHAIGLFGSGEVSGTNLGKFIWSGTNGDNKNVASTKADIQVSNVRLDKSEVTEGENSAVRFTVSNKSGAHSYGSVTYGIYLSKKATFGSSAKRIDAYSAGTVYKGEVDGNEYECLSLSSEKASTYYINVVGDYNNRPSESNEDNIASSMTSDDLVFTGDDTHAEMRNAYGCGIEAAHAAWHDELLGELLGDHGNRADTFVFSGDDGALVGDNLDNVCLLHIDDEFYGSADLKGITKGSEWQFYYSDNVSVLFIGLGITGEELRQLREPKHTHHWWQAAKRHVDVAPRRAVMVSGLDHGGVMAGPADNCWKILSAKAAAARALGAHHPGLGSMLCVVDTMSAEIVRGQTGSGKSSFMAKTKRRPTSEDARNQIVAGGAARDSAHGCVMGDANPDSIVSLMTILRNAMHASKSHNQ